MARRAPPPPDPSSQDTTAVVAFARDHASWVDQINRRYLSWNEVRRRPIPGGARPELAWAVVAMSRGFEARWLPLQIKGGEPFKLKVTDQILEWVLHAEAAAADPFRLADYNAEDERRYLRGSLQEEAIHSSLIEGAVTTRAAAKQMLREGRRPRDKSERMIVNNFRTVEMLAELAEEPLTPAVILDIHRSITEGTLDDPADAGRIQRAGEERVRILDGRDGDVVHLPPPAEELPARMDALCDFANAGEPFLPPLVRASLVHHQLAYDHPFVDGNGRTARALFYWQMLRAGHRLARYLSISRVIYGSKRRYERAYVNVSQTRDATYFVHYQVDVYRQAIDALATYLSGRREEARRASELLRTWLDLNHRQRDVVHRGLEDDGLVLTVTPHSSRYGVTRPTARADLKRLVQLGLLEQRAKGRRFYFTVPSDLRERVERGPAD